VVNAALHLPLQPKLQVLAQHAKTTAVAFAPILQLKSALPWENLEFKCGRNVKRHVANVEDENEIPKHHNLGKTSKPF